MILILLDPLLLALTLRLSRKLIRPEPGTLCGRGPCVSKCREPTPPKRDVKGPRTILLVAAAQTTLTAFQRRNTRFSANFIADWAAEARYSPRRFGSCTTAACRKASRYCEDNPR